MASLVGLEGAGIAFTVGLDFVFLLSVCKINAEACGLIANQMFWTSKLKVLQTVRRFLWRVKGHHLKKQFQFLDLQLLLNYLQFTIYQIIPGIFSGDFLLLELPICLRVVSIRIAQEIANKSNQLPLINKPSKNTFLFSNGCSMYQQLFSSQEYLSFEIYVRIEFNNVEDYVNCNCLSFCK